MRVESLPLSWIEALIDRDAAFTETIRDRRDPGMGWIPMFSSTPRRRRRSERRPVGSASSSLDDDGAARRLRGVRRAAHRGEVEIGHAIAPAVKGLATMATRTLDHTGPANRGEPGPVSSSPHDADPETPSTAALVHRGFDPHRRPSRTDDGVDDVWRRVGLR